jgi:hypothetical protein
MFTLSSKNQAASGVGLGLPQAGSGISTNLEVDNFERGPKFALNGDAPTIVKGTGLVTSANVQVLIDGIDFSEAYLTLDASIAQDKFMEGRLGLTKVVSLSAANIRDGQRLVIRLGSQEIKGYVNGRPTRSGSTYTVEFRGSPPVRDKNNYCGPVPTSAGQLARIYCEANRIKTRGLPDGHSLAEVVDNFTNEPLSILGEVYAPTGHSVHEDFHGFIQVLPDSGKAIQLRRDEYVSVKHGTSSEPLATNLIVENNFSRNDGYETTFRRFSVYSDNYNPDNTYPFFSGGWTRTDVVEEYKGATLIKREEEVYGYITNNDVFAKDVNFIECDLTSPVAVTFKKLYTRTRTLYFVSLASGYDAIYAEDFNVVGSYAQQGQADRGNGLEAKWFLRNGEIERQVKRYVLEEQTKSDICKRDQSWLVVDTRVQKYGFLNGGQFSLTDEERVWFTADRPINEDYRNPRVWTQYSQRSRYDQPVGSWVETPVVKAAAQPPQATFVQPTLTSTVVRGTSQIWEAIL